MSIRRMITAAIAPSYSIAVAALIFMLSGSPYEYMIGEIDDGKKMTICDLPRAADDFRDVATPLTGVLVLVLLITGTVRSIRMRRVMPSLMLAGILAVLWAYRFFFRTFNC